jgi:hypothetical protein
MKTNTFSKRHAVRSIGIFLIAMWLPAHALSQGNSDTTYHHRVNEDQTRMDIVGFSETDPAAEVSSSVIRAMKTGENNFVSCHDEMAPHSPEMKAWIKTHMMCASMMHTTQVNGHMHDKKEGHDQ